MDHQSQPRDLDPGRTRIGMEPLGRAGDAGVAPGNAERRGARVWSTGHLFETAGGAPGRPLVIKTFPWAAGLAAEVVRNFTDDATRVANLHHPHVVTITESGCLDDGTPFVVMERLRGQTLEERLAQRGPLPRGEVVSIVRGVAAALSVAHASGVMHRELRADNVFIEETAAHQGGFPRLLDFGVARLSAAARAAGRVVRDASASDVAPELRRDHGDGAGHRADQFALAALVHRLLRGAVAPYGAPAGAAFQRLWDQPPRAEAAGASVIAAVDVVLARAMSWRPEWRFESVASFLFAFEEALSAPSPAPPAPAWSEPQPSPPPPAVAVAPMPAPAPAAGFVPAPLAPSLTTQFFAEGDRQNAAAAAASGTFERVPRRRAPLLAALALALAALAIIAHSGIWRLLLLDYRP